MKGSKREQRRLEAAENACRALRKALSYHDTQQHYMDIAVDWMAVWLKNSPAAEWRQGKPVGPVKKRATATRMFDGIHLQSPQR